MSVTYNHIYTKASSDVELQLQYIGEALGNVVRFSIEAQSTMGNHKNAQDMVTEVDRKLRAGFEKRGMLLNIEKNHMENGNVYMQCTAIAEPIDAPSSEWNQWEIPAFARVAHIISDTIENQMGFRRPDGLSR